MTVKFSWGLVLALGLLFLPAGFAAGDRDREIALDLSREILARGQAYSNLAELVAGGSRISGSDAAARAVEWGKAKLESYGLDRVWLQPVMVPHWERGKTEHAEIVGGPALRVAALGSSVGTPAGGIEAGVVEVSGVEQVASLGASAVGKIIFYNGPMDPTIIDTFEAYGRAVGQRFAGATAGAKARALAVLVRSINPSHDDHPHTGGLSYTGAPMKIPAAALSTRDADRLSAELKAHPGLRVKLELSAQSLAPVQSYNVIGQLNGSEKPDEFVVVGGHLDSWDLGPGAQDDGAGVVQAIEVLRAFKVLGVRPRRSVRAVLFMAEEYGGFGGREYAKQAALNHERHVAALESDRGGFTPRGFAVEGSDAVLTKAQSWRPYLSFLGADLIQKGEGGTDIGPLAEAGTALFGFLPDSARYFDFHHAETDTLEAVNPRELHLGAASISVLVWLLAEQGL